MWGWLQVWAEDWVLPLITDESLNTSNNCPCQSVTVAATLVYFTARLYSHHHCGSVLKKNRKEATSSQSKTTPPPPPPHFTTRTHNTSLRWKEQHLPASGAASKQTAHKHYDVVSPRPRPQNASQQPFVLQEAVAASAPPPRSPHTRPPLSSPHYHHKAKPPHGGPTAPNPASQARLAKGQRVYQRKQREGRRC